MHPKSPEELWDDHQHRVQLILNFLNQAADADSFDAAAWHISDALYGHANARLPLSDHHAEQILDAIERLGFKEETWPPYAYRGEFDAGIEAFATLVAGWRGDSICEDPTGPSALDLRQQVRILRNAAHNASLAQQITERAHRRRESNVRSLLAYRHQRGMA